MRLRRYSSSRELGHRQIERLFDGEVVITEKIDGSQFSFGRDEDGRLFARSRNQEIIVSEETGGMFARAIATVIALGLDLTPGWTYRGEYLGTPKQNTIAYGRVPAKYIILFDIDRGNQDYLNMNELIAEAARLGLESVYWFGNFLGPPSGVMTETLQRLLGEESALGAALVEGVVLKNYARYTDDKKIMLGTFVSEDFKERHATDWKARHPTQKDLVRGIVAEYATEPRWRKAVQHLREQGMLEGVPQDIPIVLREVATDILEEHGDEIKERLFKHNWKAISRGVTRGLPEFYKQLLLEEALE